MCTNIWWKLQKQLPGRRQADQRWVDHFTSSLVDKLGFTRCVSAPQFFWNPDRQVGMEVRMDDVHGFGLDPQVEKIKEDLPKTCPRPVFLPARKGSRLENCWVRLRPKCTDNVLEVYSTTCKTEQTHRMRCQFWGRCWGSRLKDR